MAAVVRTPETYMPTTVSRLLESLPVHSADSATGSRTAAQHLPISRAEMEERGWDQVDIVFISGDAYIDHPSFAMAVLGRVLEAAGYRVAILPQPDWRSAEPWRQFGPPRLFFAISAGNMDSMINHYTANKKVRNADAYSPGGRIGLRPDRATLAYCQRAREAFSGVPVIAGGVEASLRRLAHYDFWSDKVRRSILLDSKADLVVYGMGEEAILEMARRLDQGESLAQLRDMRGVTYALGASESAGKLPEGLTLPSFEEVRDSKEAFAHATRMIHLETNPFNARRLIQFHDRQAVVQNPPRFPISQGSMDRIYAQPFTRRPHPVYREPIPAFGMIKDSVTIMRGCFGGCTFCSITTHQGRIIQSRSEESIVSEISAMAKDPDFKGIVSDIGGPTANMYQMRCRSPEVEAVCKRPSCVHPTICKMLNTDHAPLIRLMRKSRQVKGIRRVQVASGIRMDLARRSRTYLRELARHHVGGRLKVAPEHISAKVLRAMKKPDNVEFDRFARSFRKESAAVGKRQEVVPYFIAGHPDSDLAAMIELAVFLKRNGYKPDQVQDFIPAPMDVAAAMYHTGLDPFTMKPMHIARGLKERRMQRALLQFFKPENYFDVRAALLEAGRADLIGNGCDALIPDRPPVEALSQRRNDAQRGLGDFVHRIEPEARISNKDDIYPTIRQSRRSQGRGYRPKRGR